MEHDRRVAPPAIPILAHLVATSSWPDLFRPSIAAPCCGDGRYKSTAVRQGSCPPHVVSQKHQLIDADPWRWIWRTAQIFDASPVHQSSSDQPRKFQWTGHDLLSRLRKAQQQKGNQRDGNLNPHGILRPAEEVSDIQHLLHPTEEQLNRPATFVEIGRASCRERV